MATLRKTSSTSLANQALLAATCPLNEALARVGMRWKMQVLHEIHGGQTTFGALKRRLPITDHVLGQRLRELVAEGLVTKALRGRAVAYSASDRGAALLVIMADLCAWAGGTPGAARA